MNLRIRTPRIRRAWCWASVVLLLLTACSSGSSSSPTATPGSTPAPGTSAATASGSPVQSQEKIGTVFLQLLTIYSTQGLDSARNYATDEGLMNKQGEVRMTLVLDTSDPQMLDSTASAASKIGGRVTASFDNRIQLVAPVQALLEYGQTATQGVPGRTSFFHDLAGFDHVKTIERTPVGQPTPGTPTIPPTLRSKLTGGISEGVALTNADKWQAAGITGKGVRVGIIDSSFTKYQGILAGAKVTARAFRDDGLIGDEEITDHSIHGTACAEIVHEMAPDAELFLASTDTEGSFISAVNWLTQTAHVSVISISLAWLGLPTDDTSRISHTVDTAHTAGIFVAVAAGNFADGLIDADFSGAHFAATFTDSDKDGYHDFPGTKEKNGFHVWVPNKAPFRIFLDWDDWKAPHVNYDLYLYDQGGKEVARSTDDQTKGFTPNELVRASLPGGIYTLKVKKVKATDPNLAFNLTTFDTQFEQTTPSGSIGIPADARGAATIGAIDVRTDIVAVYSSLGPTKDGRAKPDLSGPTSGLSYTFTLANVERFGGTSAATPHVAGAAALYKQAFPAAKPDDTLKYLVAHVKPPKGSKSGKNITGAGRLFLDTVPQGANTKPVITPAASGTPASTASPTPRVTATGTRAATPTTMPATNVVFTDDFSSSASGLPAAGYQNGEYHIAFDANASVSVIYPDQTVSGAATEVYEVQTHSVIGPPGNGMSLLLRARDENNFVRCTIWDDGYFKTSMKVYGSLQDLGYSDLSPAVKRDGVNALRVVVQGTKFTFFVNGQQVRQVDVPDIWTEGGFGLQGSPFRDPGEVAFDNLKVTTG